MNSTLELPFMDSPGMDSDAGSDRPLPGWLGLVTSHRRLFEAGQDGWLRPPPGSCFVLGHESFVSEKMSAGDNAIPVRLAFDVDKLPFPNARKDLERGAAGNDDGDDPRIVHWRAPIPLYATRTVEVPSDGQKTHLLAMAGQTSNVSLPGAEVAVSEFAPPLPPAGGPATPETQSLELPGSLNAIQGAMAMAVWAVPHVEPWIEVLRQALNRDAAGVGEATGRLDARWLQLPWLVGNLSGSAPGDADDRERLWRAALHCMRWSTDGSESPAALAEKIAEAACLGGKTGFAEMWLDGTRRVAAAEETVASDGERENDAGLAIRLALLRPDPMRFKTWNMDLPGLPPAVWWAASTLCGWRHGYRALDRKLRGDAGQQEFIATCALEASWRDGDPLALPPSRQASLEKAPEDGFYTLTWRDRSVLRREWKSRAKWYAADLTDVSAGRAALDLAGRLGWPCIEQWLPLSEGRMETGGNGRLSIVGDALVVEGKKRLRLAKDVDFEERIDAEEFRRRLAIEAGDLPDPPEGSRRRPATEADIVPDPQQASPGQAENGPPGLIYRPDFITEEEEAKLVKYIDDAEWSTELQRRVQQYGWYYDYQKHRIDVSVRVPRLPGWAEELGRRLVNEGLMKDLPDQLIVNEYRGKQGISPHIDQPEDFSEQIATISLLETWGMLFRHLGSQAKDESLLKRCSLTVLTGDARYKWTHEIRPRKTDPQIDGKGKRVSRSRRISLTFRRTRIGRDA